MQRKTISKFSDQWMGDPIRVAQGWNAHRNSFPKEDPKKTINHRMHPVSFADMNISYRKSAIFVVSRNAGTD